MFRDRIDAGRLLALKLRKVVNGKDFVVAGITRGGVVIAKKIADYFKFPLFPLVVKKLSPPNNSEFAIGAIGPKKTVYWDKDYVRRFKISRKYREGAVKNKSKEVERLEKLLKSEKKSPDFKNKKVIVVDDGVATGATVICASKFLKKEKAELIILATPVIAQDSFSYIKKYFDMVIALKKSRDFSSVGQFYVNFGQVENKEVIKILGN